MAKKKTSFSHQRSEEGVRNALAIILRTEMKDPRFQLISVTRVDLSRDFSFAKVYWDSFQELDSSEINGILDKAKGNFRKKLAIALNVRHVPSLSFIYDTKFVDEQNISKLLKSPAPLK